MPYLSKKVPGYVRLISVLSNCAKSSNSLDLFLFLDDNNLLIDKTRKKNSIRGPQTDNAPASFVQEMKNSTNFIFFRTQLLLYSTIRIQVL